MTRCALLLAALLCGCTADRAPTTQSEWAEPTPGFWAAPGGWFAIAENGVVNAASPHHTVLQETTLGPCGYRPHRSIDGTAAFRGHFVGTDSATGTVCDWACDDTDIQAAGTFTAAWDGGSWHVRTEVVVSDGCRSALAASEFTVP